MSSIPERVDFTQLANVRPKKKKRNIEEREELPVTKCQVCYRPTISYCSSCLFVPYCSTEHWKADQENHLKECGKQIPFKLIEDENQKVAPYFAFTGSYIPKGTLLLAEEPFVVLPTLPNGYNEDKERSLEGLKMICYKCHDHFYLYSQDEIPICSHCGIWYCRLNCDGDYHSPQECMIFKRFFSNRSLIQSYSRTMRKYIEFYLDLCVLRILIFFSYAENNFRITDQWKRFKYLSTLPRFKKLKKTFRNQYDGICYMEFMRKSVDILKCSLAFASFNREIVQQVYKTMIVYWEEYETSTNIMARVILLDRHFLSHSYCSPNVACILSHETSRDFTAWSYYTLKEIPMGTIKMMCDFSPHRFMPLPLRIMYLNEISLHCESPKCTLCEDSTDGGTHSGSIRCIHCHKGIYVEYTVRGTDALLSNFPKLWSSEYVKNVDWNCNECGDVRPFSTILETIQACSKEWENVMRRPLRYSVLSAASKFVDYYEQSILHPLNGVVLQVKFELLLSAREKQFWECGLDVYGRKLPPPPRPPQIPEWCFIRKKEKPIKLRLFPKAWNKNELDLTLRRAAYAKDCLTYLEKANPSYMAHEYSEYAFLRLESVTMGLLQACHSFFMHLDEESATQFVRAGKSLVAEKNGWSVRKIVLFRQNQNNFPLLMWSNELDLVVNMIGRDGRPIPIAETILKLMGISLGQFMMGKGAFAHQRRIQGADNWPLSKSTKSKDKG